MPIKKDDWQELFREIPAWVCSECQQGRLRQIDKILNSIETGESLRDHNNEHWDPTWIKRRFVSLLRCDNAACHDISAVGGDECEEYVVDEPEHGPAIVTSYKIISVHPAPLLFQISSEVPIELKRLVQAASALYWADPESAANKLRQAVETLLTLQKVKLYPRTGVRKALPLHSRIVDFDKKHGKVEEAKVLLAVKWLGNDGSHVGGIGKDDVLSGIRNARICFGQIIRWS